MKTRRRLLSILLTVCLLLSVLPSVATAAEGDVTNGQYTDGVWVAGGNGAITHSIEGTNVTLSKTATQVAENTYDITLQVQTSTTTAQQTAGGAVVLVIDVSGSMDYCAECGEEERHESDCPNYNRWNNYVSNAQSRMNAAKIAAGNFLSSYAGTDANASRMLAIVSFQSSANTRLEWVNVAGGAGQNSYDLALQRINALSAGGGTNLDDGLYHALALLNDSDVSSYSKNVIALTDGAPTRSRSAGNGLAGSATINSHTAAQATNVKNTGSTLYTVCFGVADEYTYNGGPTVGNFLSGSVASSGSAYNADNSAELYSAFAAITESITSGLSGDGWTATDPMPDNIQVTSAPASFAGTDGDYTWTLSDPDISTNGNVTTYTYSVTYRIELDVQSIGFVEGQYYPTNEPTYLNVDGQQYAFPVPGVKGVLPRTEVSVTKVWDDDNNRDAIRTDSVTVQLQDTYQKNGQMVTENYGDPVVLNASNDWTYTWEGMIEESEGVVHQFSAVEIDVPDGYTFQSGTEGFNVTVTNTHQIETVDVEASKVWNDNNDQDGIRPDSVQVQLYANGTAVEGKTMTLTAEGGWKGTFTGLPKNENGVAITYTVDEVAVPEGYTKQASGTVVTNTHAPATTEVSVTKVWDDANDQDGKRPDAVTINLLADGEATGKTVSLTAENGWAGTFTDLAVYKSGAEIAYTVSEETVVGYEAPVITGDAETGFTVTNKHVPEVKDVTVTKTWSDADNQDGIRPTSVELALLANGTAVYTAEVNEANQWTYTFQDIPVYANGQEIEYTVDEPTVPTGYTKTVDGFTVVNTHVPEVISIEVAKIWDDADNQDGIRPEAITVNLKNGETTVATAEVTKEGGWKYTFENLPKYENAGTEIQYTVEEVAVEGYETSIEGFEITNSYTPEVISIPVAKIWDDAEDQDGVRPASVTVNLLANGTNVASEALTAENNWTFTFANQPKKSAGQDIVYTVTEDAVEGYVTAAIEQNDNGVYEVTNTHVPAETEVSVSKVWDDANDQDGMRPETITVNLLADGEAVDNATLSAENEWTVTFTELPVNAAGQAIAYTVQEVTVEKYETAITGSAADGYVITNTHTPELIDVPVTKVWNDADNQDGYRPNDITVVLVADKAVTNTTLVLSEGNKWTGAFTDLDKYADGEEIVYSVKEVTVDQYTSEITGSTADGYTVTNSHTPETVAVAGSKTWDDANDQDGDRPESITINLLADGEKIDSKSVTEADDWSWNFENLPKYKAEGILIEYSVTEDAVDEYSTTYSGYDVTNKHTPEQTSVTVTKAWVDADDQDGIRPESITVYLLANGKETDESLVLSASNNWTGSFTELDKYEAGAAIAYTVEEVTVNQYTSEITGSQADGYTITNTHEVAKISISGSKTWEDADNQDGMRPESITINLLRNGEVIESKTVSEADKWAWTFEDLDQYEKGGELVNYAITEDGVEEYTTVVNGYNVTNTHTPYETSVSVTKAWEDNNDQDGLRPNDITVVLVANGEETDTTLVLNEGNNWSDSFTGLDMYEGGEVIEYTVKEVTVTGYNSVITGDQTDGYIITNSHTPETVEVSGSKTWDDADDQDGDRPESITINLLKNGDILETITVTAEDEWAWSFENLPKYENHGTLITYAITEDAVDEYSTEYDGYNVKNVHTPEQTSVTVTKAWADSNDQDGIRPEDIEVVLLADGEATDETLTLSADNNWTGSFTELDKFAGGVEIVYTVAEVEVEGYESSITGDAAKGYVITNAHTPETVEVSGSKTWDDADDQDGARPDSITINLLKNGKVIDTATVTAADEWKFSFEDLPKYENGGVEISYSITEEAVEGYSTVYDGYNVKNSYTPEQISITVTKAWADSDDADGLRPETITVCLYADGEYTGESIKIGADDKWTGSFTELDKFADGKEIKYTIKEVAIEGYNTVIKGDAANGFVITNSHTYIPQTGDDRSPMMWIGLLILSGAALTVTGFSFRKRGTAK